MAKLIRTFVALEMPAEVQRRAARLQQRLSEVGAPVRWVETHNIHLTLRFLGEIQDVQVPLLCGIVERVAGATKAFQIEIDSVGAYPSRDRPRILWIGVGAGADPLIAMQRSLEAALVEEGFRPEDRRFSPHATIGRLRRIHNAPLLAQALSQEGLWKGSSVAVEELVVMASELTPQGPHYTVMGRAALQG